MSAWLQNVSSIFDDNSLDSYCCFVFIEHRIPHIFLFSMELNIAFFCLSVQLDQ